MCIHVHVHCQYSRQYRTPNHLPRPHTTPTYMYHLPAVKYKNSIYLRFTHIHVHTCTCTYIHAHIMYMYMYIVHCTLYTYIFYFHTHTKSAPKLPPKLKKLRKVLFIKKFQKGQHNKAFTHHTVKTYLTTLSNQTSPPLSVLCQKNPYTLD